MGVTANRDPQPNALRSTPARAADESEFRAAFQQPQRFIEVGHSRLAYYAFGQGPDLLFIHGWPLHSATFRRILPTISRHFRCHLLDLPGAGHTLTPIGPHIELEAHAETLGAAIDQLGMERYQVLAHDSGAVVARLLAARDARVSGLVYGNSEVPGHRPWLIELYATLARLPGAQTIFKAVLQTSVLRRSPLAFGGCFADRDYAEGEFYTLFVAPLLSSGGLEGSTALLRYLDWDVIDGLGDVHRQIRAPVRLIWGARDPFFPLHKAEATLHQFGGGAELVAVPEGKLLTHEDFPQEFARLAMEFLLVHTA